MASAKAAADLVPHILAEGFSARGPVFLVDIEAVEDVEIFKDRISIACHRQYAKQFARRFGVRCVRESWVRSEPSPLIGILADEWRTYQAAEACGRTISYRPPLKRRCLTHA